MELEFSCFIEGDSQRGNIGCTAHLDILEDIFIAETKGEQECERAGACLQALDSYSGRPLPKDT